MIKRVLRLKRVFATKIDKCEKCGGPSLKVILEIWGEGKRDPVVQATIRVLIDKMFPTWQPFSKSNKVVFKGVARIRYDRRHGRIHWYGSQSQKGTKIVIIDFYNDIFQRETLEGATSELSCAI